MLQGVHESIIYGPSPGAGALVKKASAGLCSSERT